MMQSRVAHSVWMLFLAVGLAMVGCSGESQLQPVQGKVLYKEQPLSGATVTFHPKVRSDDAVDFPVGKTGEDGTFTVSTGSQAGAAPGEYSVTVVCLETPVAKASRTKSFSTAEVEPQDRLKGAYANPTKSTITVVVSSGTNQLDRFSLK